MPAGGAGVKQIDVTIEVGITMGRAGLHLGYVCRR